MTDDLRTCIIKLLTDAELASQLFVNTDGYHSARIRSNSDAATIAADAVIEALKLHRDEELDEYGGYVPTGRHRYVTEWTTDE